MSGIVLAIPNITPGIVLGQENWAKNQPIY